MPNNQLQKFLNIYRISKNDGKSETLKYNFTSMGKPLGSYCIPKDKFFRLLGRK